MRAITPFGATRYGMAQQVMPLSAMCGRIVGTRDPNRALDDGFWTEKRGPVIGTSLAAL